MIAKGEIRDDGRDDDSKQLIYKWQCVLLSVSKSTVPIISSKLGAKALQQ
jgi:hypothetical protein